MGEVRTLAEKAVAAGLLGADLREEVPVVPEKYELVRPLGRGGARVVWLARDTGLDRYRALKFLNDVPPSVLERFRREARFAARLATTSIVAVHEMDEFAGRPYIAMEYIDGGNLAQAQLGYDELARVLLEVARALQHAHARGIVHRDIKPENILLDSNGRAYVTDFGIARDLGASAGITLSTEGQIMGTPACMPPEQARGALHAVDARSDVYALGATLFFKLTGRWPFEGDSVVDVLHAVLHADPPFPRSIRPDIPRPLEAIALKCLRKERDERYASMQALANELERFLGRGQVQSESSAWFKKLVRQIQPESQPAAGAPAPAPDPYWTLGMDVARRLARWDADAYRISRDLPRTFESLERIARRLAEFLDEKPDAAWARFYRGMALGRLGRLEEALEEMERAVDRAAEMSGAYFELGRTYVALHLRAQHRARRHIAHTGVEEDLRAARPLLKQAALAFEEARRHGEDLPVWQLRYADAVGRLSENDFNGCVAECDAILAVDADAEEVWRLRGDALKLSGGDPFESYENALAIRRSDYGVCLAMAEAWLDRGELDRAAECLRRALAIHPRLVDAEVQLARLCLSRGATEEGLAITARCLARAPEDYELHATRAELLLRHGELEEAFEVLARASALEGCQNRINLLKARARLGRARRAIEDGGNGRADLEAVRAMHAQATQRAPNEPPWSEVLEEAQGLGG